MKKYLYNKINSENKYKELVTEFPISFTKLNFPLITGIERLSLKYYRDFLIKKDLSNICRMMKSYIEIMENDKELQ